MSSLLKPRFAGPWLLFVPFSTLEYLYLVLSQTTWLFTEYYSTTSVLLPKYLLTLKTFQASPKCPFSPEGLCAHAGAEYISVPTTLKKWYDGLSSSGCSKLQPNSLPGIESISASQVGSLGGTYTSIICLKMVLLSFWLYWKTHFWNGNTGPVLHRTQMTCSRPTQSSNKKIYKNQVMMLMLFRLYSLQADLIISNGQC